MGIAVLGALSVNGGSTVLSRRDRVVLQALVVHLGEVVPVDRIADALWGDALPPSASKIVQGCVVRLRKALGSGAIETTPAGYRLRVPSDEIDAQRFDRALRHARELVADGEGERATAVLEEAFGLWRGDPLPDLRDWDDGRIEAGRLTDLRLEADELYVEAALRSGRFDQVLSKAAVMVKEAPLRERRWTLLARTQYQAGRQGDALGSLRRLRGLLDTELGLDPGPDVGELEQAILHQDPSLSAAPSVMAPRATCPYPGLVAYDVGDAASFFGRDDEVAECLRRLRETSVLAVVGPSGSGKSSLVRAGVAASMTQDGHRVDVLTPGAHPMTALAGVSPRTATTLIVDQCEEVFSICEAEAERKAFLTALTDRATTSTLVLSLRADRLADIATHEEFTRLVECGLFLIRAMGEPDLRRAIEGPAIRAGLVVEPGLVDLLVREVEHQPGALPLLSHVLAQTWERREGRTLTLEGYHASGGIRGAVAQSAEAIYTLVSPEQQAVLREMLLRLVSPGEDGVPVRTRLPRRLLIDDQEHDEMVDMLVAARLVTSDDGVIELGHVALAHAWPRLRSWLEEDVDGQRVRNHVAFAADAWEALGRPDSELYRGARLSTALELQRGSGNPLTPTERDFLDQGERVADAERVATAERARVQQRTNRRLRGLLSIACILLVATLIAGLLAVRQADRADTARRTAERLRDRADAAALTADSRRLGARALTTRDISLSMLLAVQGMRLENSFESRANLTATLAKHAQLVGTIIGKGHRDPLAHGQDTVRSEVVGIPGGSGPFASLAGASTTIPGWSGARWFLATSDGTNRVLFYDGAGDFLGAHPVGERRSGQHDVLVTFRPGSYQVAAGLNTADPAPLKLFDALTRRPIRRQLRGFPDGASSVVDVDFSGNGRYLAGTFSSSGRHRDSDDFALVWDLRRRDSPRRLELASAENGLAVSPDGGTVYTSWPLTARDVSTGRRLWRSPLKGAQHLDIDGSGSVLAMPEWDGVKNNNVVLVDARTGRLERRLLGHREQTRDARFSPDGSLLASLSNDDTVLVWDVRRGTVRDVLETGRVNAVSFSPDAGKLVSAGEDSALRMWDLSGEARYLPRIGTGPAIPISGGFIHPSPDGLSLVYSWEKDSSGERSLRFHDVVTDTSGPTTNSGHASSAAAGAWSPDRSRYATGGDGGLIRVWSSSEGTIDVQREVGSSPVTGMDYSPGGDRLVATERSGLVYLIDARTLRPMGPPVDLAGDACCVAVGADPGRAFAFSDASNGRDNVAQPSHTRWNLVDLETGTVLRSRDLGLDVLHADVSPDGKLVAVTGVGGEMWLLDARTGDPIRPAMDGHDADASWVTYSDDGALVATTATDGTVSLWDGRTGGLLGTVALTERMPLVAEFQYGDTQLLIASDSGGIYNWDTSEYWATSFACRLAGRTLTRAEWREFLGDRPYRPKCPVAPSVLAEPLF